MTAAQALLELGQLGLWHGVLVFLRVAPAVSLMPGFGEQSLPVRLKLAASLAMTGMIAPLVPQTDTPPWSLDTLFWSLATETLIGLILGIGLRLFMMVLQTAGTIAAQSTSLSQIMGNAAEPTPAMGHVLVIAGIALFMIADLHIKFLAFVYFSYEVFPFGAFPSPQATSSWGLLQITRAFALAFQLAGPFVIVSLLYNLALGAINRAMPQLMVAFVGAPAITAGGLVLLALLSPVLLSTWLRAVEGFMSNPFGGP